MTTIEIKTPIAPPLIYGNFRIISSNNNSCFQENSRNDCNAPFIALREKFLSYGIELNNSDSNFGKEVLFEIHMGVHMDFQTDVAVSLF